MKILIDPEFKALLPTQTKETIDLLRSKLKDEGCKEDLPYWDNGSTGILLDGHTRRDICKEEKIDVGYRAMKFDSREKALQWVIDNQLARRNLTDEQKAYYIGKSYLNGKQSHGGQIKGSAQNEHSKTSEEIGEKHGVSAATVRRDAEFAAAVDEIAKQGKEGEEEAAKILAGKSGRTKSQVAGGKKKEDAEPDPYDTLAESVRKKAKKMDLTGQQIESLAQYTDETQDALVESVLSKKQTLVQALESGEVPEETIEDVIRDKNHVIEVFCRKLMKIVDDECPADEWLDNMGRRDGAIQKFKDACTTLRTAKCHGPCPKCEGEGCHSCLKTGRVPKAVHDQLT